MGPWSIYEVGCHIKYGTLPTKKVSLAGIRDRARKLVSKEDHHCSLCIERAIDKIVSDDQYVLQDRYGCT